MRRACGEVEALIDRRSGGLAEAERLVLEEHLAICPSCRRMADMMRGVIDVLRAAPTSLTESARERVISAAFARAEEPPRRARSTHPAPRRIGFALAAAAALLLCVRLAVHRSDDASTPSSGAATQLAVRPSAPPVPVPTVHEPVEESAPPSAPWIESREVEVRRFAHARVRSAPGTRVRFDAETRTLELGSGRVEVDVDAARHASFAVLTESFRVEVLGTQFVVTPERVSVQRGRVRVVARDGSVLARSLGRGTSYRYGEPSKHTVREAATPERSEPAPEAQLREVRAALARSDVEAARSLLDALEARTLTRAERAEQETLRAECALLDRDGARALRIYLGVAGRFGELPAGENAAFAAAQLSLKADPGAARGLFERYLARYPEGRFAEQARARLERLAPSAR